MNQVTKFIVITSIFQPTEAVKSLANLKDWQLVVVGDKKSPLGWNCQNVIYLSPEKQEGLGYSVTELLPWNHYSRKVIGYLFAIEHGAEIIVDLDDDNIPLEGWDILPFEGRYKTVFRPGFLNAYALFTKDLVWPRGYPLSKILEENIPQEDHKKCDVGIWQFLVDGDPDVDAIYRLTNNKPIIFEENEPVVLDKQTVCPFNSQNTAFRKELFPLMYLPGFASFRFTDILRGLVAQPILWQHGYLLGFAKSAVIQKRNPHNLMEDFESEIPVYLYSEKIIGLVNDSLAGTASIEEGLVSGYNQLHQRGIIDAREIALLKLWLSDMAMVTRIN